MRKSKREGLDSESDDQKFREEEWKKVEILIGFRKWDREAWGGVSGLRYADTECMHIESDKGVKFW